MQSACIAVFCFLVVFLHTGSALKCWSCDSRGNRHCGDPFNKTRVALYDCDRERSPYPYSQNHNFVCKKYKFISNGDEVVLRSCATDAHQACNPSSYAPDKEAFCEICGEDGCNSGFRQTTSAFLIILSVSLWAVAAKIL